MTDTADQAAGRPRYRSDQIEARVAALMEQAHAADWPMRRWRCRHDLRGRVAGQAWPGKGLLRFNPVLGAENWDDFLHNTVAQVEEYVKNHDTDGLLEIIEAFQTPIQRKLLGGLLKPDALKAIREVKELI